MEKIHIRIYHQRSTIHGSVNSQRNRPMDPRWVRCLWILWFFVAAQQSVRSMAPCGPVRSQILSSSISTWKTIYKFVDGWGGNRWMKNLQRVRPTIGGGCKVLDIHPYFGKVISYKSTIFQNLSDGWTSYLSGEY